VMIISHQAGKKRLQPQWIHSDRTETGARQPHGWETSDIKE
jgi:hypothetical protein